MRDFHHETSHIKVRNLLTTLLFQAHPLRSSKFSITLGKPAPPLNQHEEKAWYKANLSRAQVFLFYMYRWYS
jgi:hypothetical protein